MSDQTEKTHEEKPVNLQPQLRFQGFTDPWEQRKLGGLFELDREKNDGQFSIDQFISISSMKYSGEAAENSLDGYRVLRIGDAAYEGHKNKQFAYGRFVVNDFANGIISSRFRAIRPKVILVNLFWKYYLHNEQVIRPILIRSTKLGTMMNELVPNDLFKQTVVIPRKNEQIAIGNFFRTIDQLIAAAQRQKDLLERKKQAYLQQMFPNGDENVPALRFRGFSNIWEQQRLQNLTTRTGSGGTPSSSNPDYYGGNIPFLGISDMSERYVDTTEKSLTRLGLNNSSAWIVPSGSIVLSMYASCGKVAITRIPLATSQAFFILVVNDPILRDFIFERLEAASSLHEWNKLVSTGTQPNLNAKKLNNWQLKMPHNKEQNKIAVFFQTLDSLIITAQRKIDLLKKLKKAYLQKMFI